MDVCKFICNMHFIIFVISIFFYSCSKPSPLDVDTGNLNANAYNLDTCITDIASDVPDFFKKYFHCIKARKSESGNYINIYLNGKPPYSSWYYPANDHNYIDWYSQE